MKKILLAACLLFFALVSARAQYTDYAAPEPWQTPQVNQINRLEARAAMYSYKNTSDAVACDRTKSDFLLLNGEWNFKWVPDVKYKPSGFQSDTCNVSCWDKIDVPSCAEPFYDSIPHHPFDGRFRRGAEGDESETGHHP